MAAGLTIAEADFPRFAALFAETASSVMNETLLQKTLETDGGLEDLDFDLVLAEQLRIAAPWGQAFPPPSFDDAFEVISKRIVGDNHVKLKLRLLNGSKALDAIAFNATEQSWAAGANKIHAVYRLDVNEFRDTTTVQLLIEHAVELE